MRLKGYTLNHKTVLKLMKSLGLKGKQCKVRKYCSYKGEVGKIADNILKRNFHADKPLEKLTTNITQFKVCDKKVYLSPVMDLFNREIISYAISTNPSFAPIRKMLSDLFDKLPLEATPIFHSDQGWQYQQREYQRLLAKHNITPSMSRQGNCYDNAMAENFFSILKTECIYRHKPNTFEEAKEMIDRYIHFYNHERIQLKSGATPLMLRHSA